MDALMWLRNYFGGVQGGGPSDWNASMMPDLTGTVAVVTGVSVGGIGYEVAKELYAHGSKVYILCRSESKAVAAINLIERACTSTKGTGQLAFIHFDLTAVKSGEKAAKLILIKEKRLDILVANAGVMAWPYKLIDGIELQFYNHLGHYALITPLLPLILQSSLSKDPLSITNRVVVVSSVAHQMAFTPKFDNNKLTTATPFPFGTFGRYAQSKLLNILHVSSLDDYFFPTSPSSYPPHLKIFSAHPGPVATSLYEGAGASYPFIRWFINWAAPIILLTPEEGARTVLYAAAAKEIDEQGIASGAYFVPFVRVGKPSRISQDKELAKQLWNLSERLVKERT